MGASRGNQAGSEKTPLDKSGADKSKHQGDVMKISYIRTPGPVKGASWHIHRSGFVFSFRGDCRLAIAWLRILKTMPELRS